MEALDFQAPAEEPASTQAAKPRPQPRRAARRPLLEELEEPENHERWLVSYADFITLLFAFFVVMYALSSINLDKYKVMSDSIVQALHHVPNAPSVVSGEAAGSQELIALNVARSDNFTQSLKRKLAMRLLKRQADDIKERLADLVAAGKVTVSETPTAVVVDINSDILFAPGEAELSRGAIAVLAEVSAAIQAGGESVLVEGHTDGDPIANSRFPSNWELSAARAAGVVRHMAAQGIHPERLRATGFGEFRPVAENFTPQGRQENRRVRLRLMAEVPTD